MRIALVTTTIGVPEVLREYRELGPEVPFVIAGDRKSPHWEIEALCDELGHVFYFHPDYQEQRFQFLSDTIGWDSIQRRNLAIVAAARTEPKPDVIVSVDDDNAPRSEFFDEIEMAFSEPWHGKVANGAWFNLGELAEDPFVYRGYPLRQIQSAAHYSQNGQPRRIGILNGLIYGDPDTTAENRIESNPEVFFYHPEAQRGIALDPSITWSPIDAQVTAYRAELAPLMLQVPRVGRYDDIWGSYIAQAVLRGTGYHVLFGPPFVEQDRHPHDLEKDLADERLGMAYSLMLCDFMRRLDLQTNSILGRLREVLIALETLELDLPHDFFEAWLEVWDHTGADLEGPQKGLGRAE